MFYICNMNLNERISKIITYSELTPSEFADEIEVQRSNISHIASGRNKPSLDFLVKIKTRFPELQWDWIIAGEGEMVKPKEEIEEKPKPTPVPDLFSIIADENFGVTESEDRVLKENAREFEIPVQESIQQKISDSQRLENQELNLKLQTPEIQQNKIKRIVWFYENGKFESFEP